MFSVKTKFLNFLRRGFINPLGEYALIKLMSVPKMRPVALRFLPNHYQYAPGSIRHSEVNGISFELEIHNWNDWEVYFQAIDTPIKKLIEHCKPGQVIMDVGTNIGFVAMNFAKKVGPTGRVFGFEPFPLTYEKLTRNLSLNKLENISVFPIALGAQNGHGTPLVMKENNLGRNKIIPEEGGGQIQITTIDLFCEEHHISKLDLIKLDVEGFEFQVLQGAAQTIQKFHPKLFVEISDQNLQEQGTSPQQVLDYIKSFGYTLRDAKTGVSISENDFSNCHFDVIGIVHHESQA